MKKCMQKSGINNAFFKFSNWMNLFEICIYSWYCYWNAIEISEIIIITNLEYTHNKINEYR